MTKYTLFIIIIVAIVLHSTTSFGSRQTNKNRLDYLKPGDCPSNPPGTAGMCLEACTGDFSCDGMQKCCSNGCGHVCKHAVFKLPPPGQGGLKPGICPFVRPGTVGACLEACSGDSSCPETQKCCSNGCGRACRNVY